MCRAPAAHEPSPLGPGTPDESCRHELASLDVRHIVAENPLVDRDMATCCIAGLWLLHDFLDESHAISQGIPNQSGSFWHGIMHRRERDYSNAKYWFRRVGDHPTFSRLCREVRELAGIGAVDKRWRFLAEQERWDPFAFVDACEAAIGSAGPAEALCRQVAQCEWQILFDYCYQRAIGRSL